MDDIVTVSDVQLVAAMKFFAERMKIMVEPYGCLAATAALQTPIRWAGKKDGILISGDNVDLARFAQLVTGA